MDGITCAVSQRGKSSGDGLGQARWQPATHAIDDAWAQQLRNRPRWPEERQAVEGWTKSFARKGKPLGIEEQFIVGGGQAKDVARRQNLGPLRRR